MQLFPLRQWRRQMRLRVYPQPRAMARLRWPDFARVKLERTMGGWAGSNRCSTSWQGLLSLDSRYAGILGPRLAKPLMI